MGEKTTIEWTDHTWNPWWGCVRVSPGCEHCYAETFAKRTGHAVWGPAKTTERRLFGDKHWAEPLKWSAAAEKAGVRERVFCASMADVFEKHPALDAERAKVWQVVEATPWLDWQFLTKRIENVLGMVPESWLSAFPPNVWIGTSVEDQKRADERIPHLLGVPAVVRFLSCEPLLGPVDLRAFLWRPMGTWEIPGHALNDGCTDGEARRGGLHWVIVGGESGPGARPCHVQWLREIRNQCTEAGVAIFVKQLGSRPHFEHTGHTLKLADSKGGDIENFPGDLRVREMPVAR